MEIRRVSLLLPTTPRCARCALAPPRGLVCRTSVTRSRVRRRVYALREFAPRIIVVEARFPGRGCVELLPLRALRDAIDSTTQTALVVVTSSDDRALERTIHSIGVDAFWRLPIDVSAFRENLAWLRHRGAAAQPGSAATAAIIQRGEPHGFEIEEQTCRPVHGSVLEALCAAQELADPALGAHAQRVARFAQTLCRSLELGPACVTSVIAGALLHDVGHLPRAGSVTPEARERAAVLAGHTGESAEHLAVGRRLLERLGHSVPSAVREVVVHHHERWDGRGRPTGYAGHEIPFAARIVAVCDVFDEALRDAAEALQEAEAALFAIERLRAAAGSVLDPDVVDTLVAALRQEMVTGSEHRAESRARERPSSPTVRANGG